jgi:dipeptidyl aminopeptidase/acylaminoacyl peptidase
MIWSAKEGDHVQTPQFAPDAPWKQRFRVPMTFTQVARAEPARGLAVSNRSGVYQLYAWDVASGGLQQLTDIPAGKTGGVIAPDGRFVYYLHDQDGNELGHWVRVPFAGGPAEDVTPDLPPYASWSLSLAAGGGLATLVAADEAGFHLFAIDLGPAGEVGPRRHLLSTPRFVEGISAAADGRTVVVALNERSDLLRFNLVALDAATGERAAELWDGPETSVSGASFAPLPGDMRVLAVSNRSGVQRPLIWNPLTGERRDLALGDLQGDVEAWGWWPDGSAVLLCHIHAAVQRLYRYDLATDRLRRLDHPAGTLRGAYVRTQDEIVAHWTDSSHPPQVVALDAASGAQRRTLITGGEVPPGRPWRSVTFPSTDGALIQGWLALPEGQGPFPAILDTHGGPSAATMESFSAGAQMWLDHGFAFLSINYRGSTTFGKAFEESIYGDLGRREVDDMAAARDFLIREGIAQPDAILLTGWSYGGYLTLMGLGLRPELWAGGMAGIAIADWTVQYEDTAPTLRGYQEAIFGGTPAQKPEAYARSSPITYAERLRSPVLVIQGRNDTRCPARPMEQYEARLRALGKQIEVEWFDAGHGSYQIEQQIDHHELMLRFAYRVLG